MVRSSVVLAVALLFACAPGRPDNGATEGGTGTSTSTGTTSDTTAGSTMTPTTGTGTTGTTTTGTTTSVDPSTTDGENCPKGYSAGCCFGDGVCCPCVGFDCVGSPVAIEDFQQCACQEGVCADACAFACEGDAIDVSCFVCAEKAGRTTCAQQYAACGAVVEVTCDPPPDCESCEHCALSGECYDAWFACWSDKNGCQDLIIQCEPSCQFEGPACLQQCADAFPGGAGMYQQYLDCVYCSSCAAQCGDVGVTCPP